MFVNRIYLYDDKLVITFNHKNGTETITLEDVGDTHPGIPFAYFTLRAVGEQITTLLHSS